MENKNNMADKEQKKEEPKEKKSLLPILVLLTVGLCVLVFGIYKLVQMYAPGIPVFREFLTKTRGTIQYQEV